MIIEINNAPIMLWWFNCTWNLLIVYGDEELTGQFTHTPLTLKFKI